MRSFGKRYILMVGALLAGSATLAPQALAAGKFSVIPGCELPSQASEKAQSFPCTSFVQFWETESGENIELALRGAGVEKRRQLNNNLLTVNVRGAAQLLAITSDPRVRSVFPNRIVRAIARKERPSSGGGTSQPSVLIPEGVKAINADKAWSSTTGGNVSIAIVDTGINDVDNNLNLIADCFDAFEQDCSDGNGHGTHVAGIAAAKGTTVKGVAPGAKVYAVRVLDNSGSGSEGGVIQGLEWIAERAKNHDSSLKVVNMSLGRSKTSTDPDSWTTSNSPYYAAIEALNVAGIAVVVAAGNDSGSEINAMVPAGFDNVIPVASVTAVDGNNDGCRGFSGVIPADTASYFTTDGAGIVISAPGGTRETVKKNCFLQGEGIESLSHLGGTTKMSGTSMAAPHVAGAMALYLEDHSGSVTTGRSIALEFLTGAVRGAGAIPYDSPASSYSFDEVREGVLDVSCLAPSADC